MKNLFLAALFGLAGIANASTVAIIDSGTDMLHKDIYPQAWINPLEIPRNDRDEDRNGYQDDVYGWNFAEQNAQVIDYSYLGRLTYDIRRFFEIQTKSFYGTATQEERDWVKMKVSDQEFIQELSVYGNFMHGTHVAGIAAKDATDAKIMAVKLIPTEVKLPGQSVKSDKNGVGMFLLKQGLGLLAKQQMTMLAEIAAYVDGHKADVANGSFGTGYPQAKMIVETLAKGIFRKEPPTEEQIHEVTMYFLNTLIKEGDHMVQSAEDTLFVFAAGNDGLDNDKFATSPTNIQADNVISVAATIDFTTIAPFSNYGEKMVDVAAPGVGIESPVPGNQYLKVSGTSQAAPYVANVAAQIKDANKELSPREMRKILMGTVDVRAWLKGKVSTSGLVNSARAIRAAVLSNNMSIDRAIRMSLTEVADVAPKSLPKNAEKAQDVFVAPLPSMFKL